MRRPRGGIFPAKPRRKENHPMRLWMTSAVVVLAAGCGVKQGKQDTTGKLPSYLLSSTCTSHSDQSSCNADNGCSWISLGAPCPAGTTCPSGACVPNDPCAGKPDEATCESDSSCAWSQVAMLC